VTEPAVRTELGIRGFERSLPMALIRAREAVMRRFRPTLNAHGLTEQQWRVLRALADADRPVSVGELADATLLLGPSLSRMLATLATRGLVTRSSDGDDGRRSEISITTTGRELVAVIGPSSELEYARIADHLGHAELAELYRLLARLGELPLDTDLGTA
jgi:homoprotocatechuate degradation regulator HpaR